MRSTIIVFSLFGLLGTAAHAGEIFRCVATDGAVMFTNLACPASSTAQHVANYTPVPDAPLPAYSKPSFAPVASAQSGTGHAQAAYQAGYEQAQADAQSESSRGDDEYAAGWIPYYPGRRTSGHDHRNHPRKIGGQAPSHSGPGVVRIRH